MVDIGVQNSYGSPTHSSLPAENGVEQFPEYDSRKGCEKLQSSSWLSLEDLDFLIHGDFNKSPRNGTSKSSHSKLTTENGGIWGLLGIPAPSNKKVPWIGRSAVSSALGFPKSRNLTASNPARRSSTSRPLVLLTTSAISPRAKSLGQKKLTKMRLSLPLSPSLTLSEQHIANYFPNASKVFKNVLLFFVSKNASVAENFPKVDPKILACIRNLEQSVEIKSAEESVKRVKVRGSRANQHGIRLRSGKSSPLRIIGGIELRDDGEECRSLVDESAVEPTGMEESSGICAYVEGDAADLRSPVILVPTNSPVSTMSIQNSVESSPGFKPQDVVSPVKECMMLASQSCSPDTEEPPLNSETCNLSTEVKEDNGLGEQEEKTGSIHASSPSNETLSPEFASSFKAPLADMDAIMRNHPVDSKFSDYQRGAGNQKTKKQKHLMGRKINPTQNRMSVPILQCFTRPRVNNGSYPNSNCQSPVSGCRVLIMLKPESRKRHKIKIASSCGTPKPNLRSFSSTNHRTHSPNGSILPPVCDEIEDVDNFSHSIANEPESQTGLMTDNCDLHCENNERLVDLDNSRPLTLQSDDQIVPSSSTHSAILKPSVEESFSDKPMANEKYSALSVAWSGDSGQSWKGSDANIRWERLSPRLAALGKEVVFRRNALASAAADKLQEAASAEMVLSALSHFCELGTVVGVEHLSECVNRFIPFHDILINASRYTVLMGKDSKKRSEMWGMWGHVMGGESSPKSSREGHANHQNLQQTALWAGSSTLCDSSHIDSSGSNPLQSGEVLELGSHTSNPISPSGYLHKPLLNGVSGFSLENVSSGIKNESKKLQKKETGWKKTMKYLFCSTKNTISPAQTPFSISPGNASSSEFHSPRNNRATASKMQGTRSPTPDGLSPSPSFSPSPKNLWHRSCFVSQSSPNPYQMVSSSPEIKTGNKANSIARNHSRTKETRAHPAKDRHFEVENKSVVDLYRQVEREARIWFISYTKAGLDFEMHKIAQGDGDSDSLLDVTKRILAWVQTCQTWANAVLSSSRVLELERLQVHLEEIAMLCSPIDSSNFGTKPLQLVGKSDVKVT